MDSIESNIKSLLSGQLIEDQNSDICDFTLKQQIQDLGNSLIYLYFEKCFQLVSNQLIHLRLLSDKRKREALLNNQSICQRILRYVLSAFTKKDDPSGSS